MATGKPSRAKRRAIAAPRPCSAPTPATSTLPAGPPGRGSLDAMTSCRSVEESDGAELDALARRRAGRRRRVLEGGVRRKARDALVRVPALDQHRLVHGHVGHVEPALGVVLRQAV